ncbi:MAG: hypothetical protein D6748_06945 [Calditrichaeota bacterium]|nr:MAG: hypothetical protein D6748_06945 [Calditrichota bacterium]
MKVFEKIQVDVKELCDIPRYYPFLIAGWPIYQITARNVRSGFCLISYAYENNATHAATFASVVLNHLKRSGVELSQCYIQTDNGSEFVVPYGVRRGFRHNRKNPFDSIRRYSLFQQVLGAFVEAKYRIPPRASTYNIDVEAFHRIVVDEFYDWGSYQSRRELLQKAYNYMRDFNQLRTKSYKENLTPVDIIKQVEAKINVNT